MIATKSILDSKECVNTGNISGSTNIGGLIGCADTANGYVTLRDSYNMGLFKAQAM